MPEAVRQALAAAAAELAPVSDTPRLDAELLMAHALGVSREDLLLQHRGRATPPAFAPLLRRRLAREPVAYIIGRRAFWTIEIEVGPGVLVPRPDSETSIEAALALFGEVGPATILDLGTGPGTLLLAALDQWPDATGLGVDRSDAALEFAARNAARLGLAGRARFAQGNWGEPIKLTAKLPKGEAYLETEAPRGQMGFYLVSDGSSIPWRARARSSCFCNLSVTHELCRGCLIADGPAIVGSLDIVMGEIDR